MKKSVWLNITSQGPLFVSYYTDKFYQREAFELARSCQRFSLDYRIDGVPDLGSWRKNTNHKPTFLLRMDEIYPTRPIVWVDADARIRAEPTLFDDLPSIDVAFHMWEGKIPASGTVFLRAGEQRARILKLWITEVEAKPNATDQVCMASALDKHFIGYGGLPVEYCWIYDHEGGSPDASHPVIEHMQASRWSRWTNRKKGNRE